MNGMRPRCAAAYEPALPRLRKFGRAERTMLSEVLRARRAAEPVGMKSTLRLLALVLSAALLEGCVETSPGCAESACR